MAVNFSAPLPPTRVPGDTGPAADMNLLVAAAVELRNAVLTLSGAAADTTAPTVASFTVNSSSGQAVLAWTVSDNVAVTRCTISRSGSVIYDGNLRTFTDVGLTNGVTYTWTLSVYDAAGNSKAASVTASPTAGTTTTLARVTLGTPTVSADSVTLAWSTALGNDGVTPDSATTSRDGTDSTGYGAYAATGDPISGTRTFNQLVAGSTYHFTVQLIEAGANYGTPATVTVTMPAATGGGSTGGGTTTPTTSFTGPRSKLPWNSGAFVAFDPSVIAPYQTGRGRLLDNISTFTTRDTVDTNLDSSYLSHASAVTSNGGWVTLGMPLWANNQSVSSDITALFTGVGQDLAASGFASRIIVRLGWEMNLPSWPHNLNGSNQTQWIAQFKKAVGLLRQYAPGVKVAFNPNEGGMQTSGSVDLGSVATQLLSYYEFCGPDVYNWYPIVNDASGWSSHYNASFGVKYWEDFARSNNKGYIVPEWGGYPGSSAGQGSDGVYYAQQMIGRFAALASSGMQVVESHFNEPSSYIANSLWDPQQMPAMATAVKNALAAQPTAA